LASKKTEPEASTPPKEKSDDADRTRHLGSNKERTDLENLKKETVKVSKPNSKYNFLMFKYVHRSKLTITGFRRQQFLLKYIEFRSQE
jgi:hypothetical protein